MKPSLVVGLVVTAVLGACSPKGADTNATAGTGERTPAATAAPATNMAAMGTSSDAKLGKGTGTVTAVDAAAGTVTLQHGPIPEVGWPAMTMAFKASPEIVRQVKTGEKVDFDLRLEGGSSEVTSVRKAGG
jgi:Cu/Ag efflux protein CusF